MKTQHSTVIMDAHATGSSTSLARAGSDDASAAHVIGNKVLDASRHATVWCHRDSSITSYSDSADLHRTRNRDSIPNMQAADREVMTRTPTPNHALQRTGSAVTAPAADHHRLSTHRQVPRPLRLSLSLGSLGHKRRYGIRYCRVSHGYRGRVQH